MTDHTESTFTGIADVSIFYQRWLPDGPPRGVVMIVHGLGEHGGRYGHLVDWLLPAGYVVYAIDHQGFGRSGGQRGHVNRFRDYAEDVHHLNGLVRAEQPGQPLAVFGHSMGGLITLDYAQIHPKDADCWIVQAPALAANTSAPLVLAARLINLLRPTYSMARPAGGDISRDPAEATRFLEDPLHVPVSSVRWVVEILAAQKRVKAQVASTPGPLLMLQGTADNMVIPAAIPEFFGQVTTPDKTLLMYDGYFHELHNDIGKEKPLGDIVEWLNERM
ncbi:MAG: lysophospholipase [Caldilineaceae bacterium]|nr:lysophospholipase [Caldilineaceae bacterium]